MVTLDVVIPVCGQSRYTKEILGYMTEQTVMPRKIIVIDNASDDDTPQICLEYARKLPLSYVRNETNIGVNASWNQGLSMSDAVLVSVLNNDLILPKFFFRKIQEVFQRFPECGMAVPRSLQVAPSEPREIPDNADNTVRELPIRQGWAFTMRRKIFEEAGPIPDVYSRTFFGDDYLFMCAREQGYTWIEMMDVPVHHYLSRTLYSSGGANDCGSDEKGYREFMAKRTPNKRTAKEATKTYKKPSTSTASEVFDENVKKRKAKVRHWTEVPMHIDMSPYAAWYQTIVQEVLMKVPPGKRQTLVEIGTRYGCSARIIIDAIPETENVKFIMIDMIRTGAAEELVDGARVEFWEGDGNSYAKDFEDGSIDLLHIDADPHAYEQTKELFNNWKSKVRVGGVVVFHDCTPFFGVHKFVTEDLARERGAWRIEFAPAASESPISAPARATRNS